MRCYTLAKPNMVQERHIDAMCPKRLSLGRYTHGTEAYVCQFQYPSPFTIRDVCMNAGAQVHQPWCRLYGGLQRIAVRHWSIDDVCISPALQVTSKTIGRVEGKVFVDNRRQRAKSKRRVLGPYLTPEATHSLHVPDHPRTTRWWRDRSRSRPTVGSATASPQTCIWTLQ